MSEFRKLFYEADRLYSKLADEMGVDIDTAQCIVLDVMQEIVEEPGFLEKFEERLNKRIKN